MQDYQTYSFNNIIYRINLPKTRQNKISQLQMAGLNLPTVILPALNLSFKVNARTRHVTTRSHANAWRAYRADMLLKTIDFGKCVRGHCSYLTNKVNFFQVLFQLLLVHSCEDLLYSFLHRSAHICDFRISTIIIHHLDGLFGPNIMISSQLEC